MSKICLKCGVLQPKTIEVFKETLLDKGITKCLIIKRPWLDLIFSGKKTLEIRSSNTKIRGKIGLIESGSGHIVGECELVSTKQLSKEEYAVAQDKHCIKDISILPYKNIWAWEIKNAKKFKEPMIYKHPQGAVIWVDVNNLTSDIK